MHFPLETTKSVVGEICIYPYHTTMLLPQYYGLWCLSFSFLSKGYRQNDLLNYRLEFPLWVSGPRCDPSLIKIIYWFFPVIVEEICFPIDLVIILEIDWLSTHSAILDYRDNVVRFKR